MDAGGTVVGAADALERQWRKQADPLHQQVFGVAFAETMRGLAQAMRKERAWAKAETALARAYSADRLYRRDIALRDLLDLAAVALGAEDTITASSYARFASSQAARFSARSEEGTALYYEGLALISAHQPTGAVVRLEAAIQLFTRNPDSNDLGRAHHALSIALRAQGRLPESLEAARKSILTHTGVYTPARYLDQLGQAYLSLGSYDKALIVLKQAHKAVDFESPEEREQVLPSILNSLAQAQVKAGPASDAIVSFKEAAARAAKLRKPRLEAAIYANLGTILVREGRSELGIRHLGTALALWKKVGDRVGEAICRHQIALARSSVEAGEAIDITRAEADELAALVAFTELGHTEGRAIALNGLMVLRATTARASVLYGKIAANLQQGRRKEAVSLDTYDFKNYSDRANVTLVLLAQALFGQNRTAEGMQALTRARLEEYLNDNANSRMELTRSVHPILYTPREAKWAAAEAAAGARLARAYAAARTSPRSERALVNARRRYLVLLDRMQADFAAPSVYRRSDWALDTTPELNAMKASLRSLGPRSAAIVTATSKDRLYKVLVTPKRTITRVAEIPISRLSEAVSEFRNRMLDERRDVRPVGHALYNLVFRQIETEVASVEESGGYGDDGAIEREIERLQCNLLLVSIDGPLRSIPFAALSPDGKTYLAQRLATAAFTLGAEERLTKPARPVARRHALIAGSMHGTDEFPPLLAVEEEVDSILGRPPDRAGLCSGSRLIEGFTLKGLQSALAAPNRYSVVHIASHFVLGSDDDNSRLLMGDGTLASLREIRATPTALFRGVDLLVLSACNTASLATSVGGREFENLAVLAQRKGASGVLGTLWSVNSQATQRLVRLFYQEWMQGESKPEALRLAQLDQMEVLGGDGRPNAATRVTVPEGAAAHPFYWAGFLLVGNAR
jgi:CHAT domain-containing protein